MSAYGDKEYRRRRAALIRQCKRNNTPCHLCGKPFDWSIDDRKHPMSFEADHLTPMANGGKLHGDLAPSHKSCNGRRQNKPLAAMKRVQEPKTSRQW